MTRQHVVPSTSTLEKMIDKRLARVFGEDALILVIYPIHSNKDKFNGRDLSDSSVDLPIEKSKK